MLGGVKGTLLHCAVQVVGTACAIASFVIATRTFKGVTYRDVDYGHGKLGVATLTLVVSQVGLNKEIRGGTAVELLSV